MEKLYPLPKGFLCSGVIAGLKEDTSRKDLGLIFSETSANLGAVYTKNRFPSAHVNYCRSLTPSSGFRALIVNSGNANAATGQAGIAANQHMVDSLAKKLKLKSDQVFSSSTGIIGRPFPIDKVNSALGKLVDGLEPSAQHVAEAIMTTDTKPKLESRSITIDEKTYTITGFAKGSGMIHPNMATMLGYILTDAPLPFSEIQKITSRVCNKSFNCVSIDGDTSTNDSFYLISSNVGDQLDQINLDKIEEAITEVAISLSKQIAIDGEGANHLIQIHVKGCPTDDNCRKVLYSVLNSSLVKTAVHGKDPNWGRILMATGNGLAESSLDDNSPLSITIQNIPVLIKGEPTSYDETLLSSSMDTNQINIEIDLHQGSQSITGWGCDLSNDYIHINADYTT